MRLNAAARIGMALIVGGILLYSGMKYWIETRSFSPLDIPVTLRAGDTFSAKFKINYSAEYWANVSVSPRPWNEEDDKEDREAHFNWVLRNSDGQEISTYSWYAQPDGTVRSRGLGYVELSRGVYTVELKVLSTLPRHSQYGPRLRVSTSDYDAQGRYLFARWLSVFLVLDGSALLVIQSSAARSRYLAEEAWFSQPPTGALQARSISKRVRENERKRFPHWSLYAALTFFSVLTPVWILSINDVPSFVILVNVVPLKAKPASTADVRVVIRVVATGKEPLYTLNGRTVPVGFLPGELRQELGRQKRWIVYIDGDSNCLHADIMKAVDAASGAHAKTILVTPATRSLIEGAQSKN